MKLIRYLLQYRPAHMAELIANEKKPPLPCEADMEGKTVVISGATSGIGLSAARLLASKGANLVLLNRNPRASAELEAELKADNGVKVSTIIADFSSLASTKACAEKLLTLKNPIDALIHNAGVYYTKRTFTQDGIEIVFQVNHLSSFCLNYLLRERLKSENRARIVHVNSEGHRFALAGVHLDDLDWKRHWYTGLKSYGAAKTAQLLAMPSFLDYYEGTGVTVNAMHPGNVFSRIGENNGKLYNWTKKTLVLSSAKSPEISAAALYYLCASPAMQGVSGKFFNLTSEERPAPHATDPSMIGPVWEKSMELCALS